MPTTNATTGTAVGGATFDQTRKFGIEIEAYNCDKGVLAAAIEAAGVACTVEGYNHNRVSHWKIVTDRSILGTNAFELVSPPLKGEAGLREIEKVCAVLKAKNVKVNRSTGLHVHHDASDLDVNNVKAILTMWWKYEDVIMYFLPPSRRANDFCKPAMPRNGRHGGYEWAPGADPVQGWKSMMDGITEMADVREEGHLQSNRYAPVNCHALNRHGTLEFRSHAGTTEFAKIHAWIVLTQWFLTRSKAKGCQIRTRMTGRWADQVMFFWKAIDWCNLTDADVLRAKNVLNRRFKHFKELEQTGGASVAAPLHRMNERGQIRPTEAAGEAEPGEM